MDIDILFQKLCTLKQQMELGMKNGDEKAFFNVLKYGICLRGISIISNIFFDNFDSTSVDLDARVIIENWAIIKGLNSNVLTWKQFIFSILSTVYASDERFLKLFDSCLPEKAKEFYKHLIEKHFLELKGLVNVDDQQLIKLINKPFSFLKFGDKTKNMNASDFITEVLGKDFNKMRNFFSFNIHPTYYSKEILKFVNGKRRIFVKQILTSIYDSLSDISPDPNICSSTKDYLNKYLNDESLDDMDTIETIFSAKFGNDDGVVSYSFNVIKNLIIDLYITGNVISWSYSSGRIKLLYEYSSMLYNVKTNNSEVMWAEISDYNICSLFTEIDSFNVKKKQLMLNLVKETKEKHHLEKFMDNHIASMHKKCCLFFIYGKPFNYKSLVRDCIYTISDSEVSPVYFKFYNKTLNENHISFNYLTGEVGQKFKRLEIFVKTYTLGFVVDLFYYLIGKPECFCSNDYVFINSLLNLINNEKNR